MKECDNSTRKIHINSNFILSISLLIMFDTLLLRPSLHCNTPIHFTTLQHSSPHLTTLRYTSHFTQIHFTTLIDISLPLIYTSLPFHLLHYPFIDEVNSYFTQKIQQDATMYQHFISYIYKAQHVSGDTPPIIRSLKLY